MKTLTLLLALAIPGLAQAQPWTPAQLEVLDHIEQCWDISREADMESDPSRFQAECTTPESRFWWGARSVPNHNSEYTRAVEKGLGMWGTKRWDWVAMGPIQIDIHDDVALVYMAPSFVYEDLKENVTYAQQRRLHVLRRIDGAWKHIGGMGMPVGD